MSKNAAALFASVAGALAADRMPFKPSKHFVFNARKEPRPPHVPHQGKRELARRAVRVALTGK